MSARCDAAQSARPFARLQRRRRLRLFLGTAASALVLGAMFAPPPGSAQPAGAEAARAVADASVRALARALDRRMTVWRTDRRVVYVHHCRSADGGCQERITTFARLIGDASEQHGLDPFLLAAVAVRESGMDPTAAGAAGERGIVQLHPRGTGARVRYVRSEQYRRYCARRPDACQDEVLDAGARLLASSITRCGGVREGLGAYNRGECGETGYARRVMSERQRLLRLAKNETRPLEVD